MTLTLRPSGSRLAGHPGWLWCPGALPGWSTSQRGNGLLCVDRHGADRGRGDAIGGIIGRESDHLVTSLRNQNPQSPDNSLLIPCYWLPAYN